MFDLAASQSAVRYAAPPTHRNAAGPMKKMLTRAVPPMMMASAVPAMTDCTALRCDKLSHLINKWLSAAELALNNEHGRSNISDGTKSQSISLPSDCGVDFTVIPHILDMAVEKHAQSSALRSTTIKAGDWTRNRQENLLTNPMIKQLHLEDTKREKNKAFNLLDALSRSGSLPIVYSDLHVIVAVTHCFDKDIMSTIVCDNINPIEKLECSTLILASAIHGVPASEIIGDASEVQRLSGLLPLLLLPLEEDGVDTDTNAVQEG